MKTSTEINSAAKIVGEEKAVELIAKAGFDAWDLSMFKMVSFNWAEKTHKPGDNPFGTGDYLGFARKLRRIGEDNGIHCNQSHAPFPSSPEIVDYLKRALECTAEAGGEICIIHPMNTGSVEKNSELYFELLPFAKGCGVKIATENMWGWDKETNRASFAACATEDDFNAHLDAINDDFFVACLDLGHAEMMGDMTNAVRMIKALDKRLKALHIHDNDRWHDSHQIPFSMQMDFDAIVNALREINYDGYFTLEADTYLSAYNADNVFEGIKKLAESARKLADMFESK